MRAYIWFTSKKKEMMKERYIWIHGRIGGFGEFPLGALTTNFLRLDFSDITQVDDFLNRWKYPPIFDERGHIVTSENFQDLLTREQGFLREFIEGMLVRKNSPELRLPELKPSERSSMWQVGLQPSQFGARLAQVSPEFARVLRPGRFIKEGQKSGLFEINGEFKRATEITFLDGVDVKRRNLETKIYKLRKQVTHKLQSNGMAEDRGKYDKKIEKLRFELDHVEEKSWQSITRWVTEDILALLWLEVYQAAQKDIFAIECQTCGSYLLYARRSDKKFCLYCGPKSHRKISDMTPEEQEEQRTEWRNEKKVLPKYKGLENFRAVLGHAQDK